MILYRLFGASMFIEIHCLLSVISNGSVGMHVLSNDAPNAWSNIDLIKHDLRYV